VNISSLCGILTKQKIKKEWIELNEAMTLHPVHTAVQHTPPRMKVVTFHLHVVCLLMYPSHKSGVGAG